MYWDLVAMHQGMHWMYNGFSGLKTIPKFVKYGDLYKMTVPVTLQIPLYQTKKLFLRITYPFKANSMETASKN